MASRELDIENLTQFGVLPEDEGPHPADPALEWWNESWFWDWFDAVGENAGHCRIGIHANQQRAWLWFFLFREGEWVAVEEPRLPLADLDTSRLAYDRWGLRFSWTASVPLKAGRLAFEGFGRVVAGRRVGMILPVGAELEIQALGPPHSIGRSTTPGHASAAYSASRFEQPITARGALHIDRSVRPFAGYGQRDHSWGPRLWNMEWTVLVLNGRNLRLQAAEVQIPNAGRLTVGYLQRERMTSLAEVQLDLGYDTADVLRPVGGRFAVKAEDGDRLSGRVEALTAAEIDLTHVFVPPERSLYRRALVRATPDGGAEPMLGWIEFNRFLERD